jgi:hypothetical protein
MPRMTLLCTTKCTGRLGLGLRAKQLAPAVRADVAVDEFARIRSLEVELTQPSQCCSPFGVV